MDIVLLHVVKGNTKPLMDFIGNMLINRNKYSFVYSSYCNGRVFNKPDYLGVFNKLIMLNNIVGSLSQSRRTLRKSRGKLDQNYRKKN